MDSPTVGVVIPTYNRPDLVLKTIESVLAQDPRPQQIIVVEDGSSLPPDPQLLRWAESGQIQFIHEHNRGTAGAMNRGAEELTTDLAIFLGDDDCLMPGAVDGLRAALIDRPDAVAAVGGIRRLFMQTSQIGELEWPKVERGDFAELLHGNPIVASAVLIRMSAFHQVGGFEARVPIVEDWDMWLRLARLGPIIFPRVEAVLYRVHGGNMSASSRVAGPTANMVEHYLRTFHRSEHRVHGPILVDYLIRTYGASVGWHARAAVRSGQMANILRETGLLFRMIKLGCRSALGRAALRFAWREHRASGYVGK